MPVFQLSFMVEGPNTSYLPSTQNNPANQETGTESISGLGSFWSLSRHEFM